MKLILKIISSTFFLSLFASNASAACSIATPADCITNPGSIGSSQRLGRFEVNVENNCDKTIWVALHYKDYYDGSGTPSCLGGGSSCYDKWVTKGWWKLYPGEKKYIANTLNRYVYFSAQASDGTEWSGDYTWELNDTYLDFFETKMTNSFTVYTQGFSCN